MSVVAYVDDTNWIATSRSQMNNILKIANEFYTMNDIMINKSKSYLIAINACEEERTQGVLMGNDTLFLVEKDFPVRSLGIYVTETGSKKFQRDRLKKSTDYMAYLLRGKPITDTQAIYIFNMVVIPMLEYNLNDMVLTETECAKITTKFLSVIKNKACLTCTTPNALMFAREAYNVCNLWDRQLQMHSSNLLNRLNDKGAMGFTTRIRLQNLQNLFWSKISVLTSSDVVRTSRNQSLINDILKICKEHNIRFQTSDNITDSLIIKGGNISIEEMLHEFNCYHQYQKSLRVRQILYLEQLTSYNGKRLLQWQEITGNNRRGPKPGWFKLLESKLLNNSIDRGIAENPVSELLGSRYNTCKQILM